MNALSPCHLDVASLRTRLWAAGWRPVALKTGDKMPTAQGWTDRARCDPPADAEAKPSSGTLNTGLLADGLRILDLDIDDVPLAHRLHLLATAMLGETLIRTRAGTGRSALIYRAAEGQPGKRLLTGATGKIEVLGHGQQLHAYGLHPSGAELHWSPKPPHMTRVDTLPAVTEQQIAEFLDAAAPLIGAQPVTVPAIGRERQAERQASQRGLVADIRDVLAALKVIPPDDELDWNCWNNVGMATWAATKGSSDGLAAWTAWTERSTGNHDRKPAERWQHFSKSPPDSIGAGTLFHLARQAQPGWMKPSEAANGNLTVPDAKRPLFRPLPPAPAFPMHALGQLREPAEAIQMRTQAPAAICAQSVLAAITLAVQAHRDVELPGGGRRPLTGLFGSVADSGERKTSVDRLALAAAYRVEEQWRQGREAQVAAFTNDHEAWKAVRDATKNKHKKNSNRAALGEALAAIGPEPKPPPQAMLLVEDFSPEALVLHLRDSRPWAGVFTSEGGALVGGHAFNDEKAMQTGALLNTLWDGTPIRRIRVLTGQAFLPGRRCSAHIMMQRVVADKLLSDAVLEGIGTTARMLIVEPESTMGSRPFRDTPIQCAAILRAYNDRMMALLTRKPITASDTPDVLDPPVMTLTPDALALWKAFHDAVEADLGLGGALHSIRAFGAKMAEHAGRLAAALTVYAKPDAMEVDAEAMACGITLAQHYATEMLRLQGGAAISRDLKSADRLKTWWQARPNPECHLAAIYQVGPGALRDAAGARRIVNILEEHGWVRRLPPGTVVDGSPRRDAWVLVP